MNGVEAKELVEAFKRFSAFVKDVVSKVVEAIKDTAVLAVFGTMRKNYIFDFERINQRTKFKDRLGNLWYISPAYRHNFRKRDLIGTWTDCWLAETSTRRDGEYVCLEFDAFHKAVPEVQAWLQVQEHLKVIELRKNYTGFKPVI